MKGIKRPTGTRSEAQEYQNLRRALKGKMKHAQKHRMFDKVSDYQCLLNQFCHSTKNPIQYWREL